MTTATDEPEQQADALRFLRSQWDIDHLRMMVQRIELDYLQANYIDCALRAQFYADLCREVDQEIANYCGSVLQRMRLGLDPFGKPSTWVPLLRLTDIDTHIDSTVQAAQAVERALDKYFGESIWVEDLIQSMRSDIDTAAASLTSTDAELTRLVDERGTLEQTVRRLSVELDSLSNEFRQQHEAFVREIERVQQRCSFEDCIKGIGLLFAVGGSVATTVGAIQTAIAVLPPGTHNTGTRRIEVVKAVGSNVAQIPQEYQRLKDGFHPVTPEDLDFEKLVLTQQKYDEFLQRYRDIAGAHRVKELADRFFDLNQQRNEVLLKYTTSFSLEAELQARRTILQQQLNTLRAGLTVNLPREQQATNAMTAMSSTYVAAIRGLQRALWIKRKAVEYAILHDVNYAVDDMQDVATLLEKRRQLNEAFDRYRAEAQVRYNPFDSPIRLLLVENADDAESLREVARGATVWPLGAVFTRFKTDGTGKMTFSLPRNCSAFDFGWSSIRLSGVAVRLVGVRLPPRYIPHTISVDLIHLGISQFVSPSHEVRWFTHTPVVAQVSYDLDAPESGAITDRNILGDTTIMREPFMGVSPFAAWQLRVNQHDGMLPLLEFVDAVEIRFFGVRQGFDLDSSSRSRA